jgi:hypothetical protein
MVKIAELVDSPRLLDRLFARFAEFPNLLPLLTFFAIKLNQLPKLAALFDSCSVACYPMLRPNRFWFVFPVIALFNSPDQPTTTAICSFMAHLLNSGVELPAITAFIKFLKYTTGRTDSGISASFLEGVRLNTDKHEGLGEICFDEAFFHFQDFCSHPQFLDAIRDAGIVHDVVLPAPIQICETLSNTEALALLAHIDTRSIPISFCFRIDPATPRENSNWTDCQVASLALSALDEEAPLRDIFWFFKDPLSLIPQRAEVIATRLDAFIQRRLADFRQQTHVVLEELAVQLRDYVKYHGHIESCPDGIEEARARVECELIRMTTQITSPNNRLKQDSRACALFSPMRQKRVAKYLKIEDARVAVVPLAEYQCVRVKRSSETKASFALTKDCFVVDGARFALETIRAILTRRRGNRETALEFYLANGKAILLDFSPIENLKIVRLFERVPLKSVQIVQKTGAAELFASSGIQELWERGMMSNFEYLMRVNIISGRSYNDRYLYPIFPAVLERFDFRRPRKLGSQSWKDALPVMSGLDTDSAILSPEYFFFPPLFANDFEFVYRHRKRLESAAIGSSLNVFFDAYFGFRMQDIAHRRLFDSPHPHRPPPKFIVARELEMTIGILKGKIVSANVYRSQRSTFVFLIISDAFQSIRLTVDITTGIRRTEELGPILPTCAWPVFASCEKLFAVLDRQQMCLHLVDDVTTRRLFLETDNDIIQFFDSDSVLYCPNRSAIASRDGVLIQTRSPVTHLATNVEFKIFAVATRDGYVASYSFPSGHVIIESDIGVDVTHLIVTEKLGLIVAFGGAKVSVLSVDGHFIKSAPFPQTVARAYSFSSFSDFDFIAFETEEHQLGFFEAFYPENSVIFCQLDQPAVQVVYADALTSFLVLLESGLLRVVPTSIDLNRV